MIFSSAFWIKLVRKAAKPSSAGALKGPFLDGRLRFFQTGLRRICGSPLSSPGMETERKRQRKPAFLDFFAGSGLATEALKPFFAPVWANDICPKKAAVYRLNHPPEIFHLGPLQEVKGSQLPPAALSWASFPCQDLSLAGNVGGIYSPRSGLVWEWLRVMDEMPRRPPLAVAENVPGLIYAAQGAHYLRLHKALLERGYRVGAVVIDAAFWTPQSRKRVFVVALDSRIDASFLESSGPLWCHPPSVCRAAGRAEGWVWWRLPEPPRRSRCLEEAIDFEAPCDSEEKTRKLLALIPPEHWRRLCQALAEGKKVFAGYRRARPGGQRLELRFDGLAGCLRTPAGGSSRQILLIRRGGKLRTRLLSVAEAARLMGLRPSYRLPGGYNEAYKAMGDAVAVPPVRFLARRLLLPLARIAGAEGNSAAGFAEGAKRH